MRANSTRHKTRLGLDRERRLIYTLGKIALFTGIAVREPVEMRDVAV
jgi:hypothetical protein